MLIIKSILLARLFLATVLHLLCLYLEEEDCNVVVVLQKHLQHVPVHEVDDVVGRRRVLGRQEPLQDLLFLVQVALVDLRELFPEVDERGQGGDLVLRGQLLVGDFDEVYPGVVALVVDVLELGEDPLRLPVSWGVCGSES